MIYDDPVLGVDVSMHQREFPWLKAAAAGCVFAWIKTSEGTGYRDPWWDRHAGRAHAAGLLWGGYHFARADGADWYADAIGEADWFVDCGGGAGTLPGALDMEHTDLSRELTIRWADVWCKRVKDRAGWTGRLPVYWGGWFTGSPAAMNDSRLHHCWWWFPSYGANTVNPSPYAAHVGWNGGTNGPRIPECWQYTSRGRIPGWSGDLDLNIAPRRAILELARLVTPDTPISEEENVRSLLWAKADSAFTRDTVRLPATSGADRHAFINEGVTLMYLGTTDPAQAAMPDAHGYHPVIATQQYFARAAGREFIDVSDEILRGNSLVAADTRQRATFVVRGDGLTGRLADLLAGTEHEEDATDRMAFHFCANDWTAYVISHDTMALDGTRLGEGPVSALRYIGVEDVGVLGDSFWDRVRLTGTDQLAPATA